MPVRHRYKLHDRGPALWPEHKPLAEVLKLRATTPDLIWSGTYQCRPSVAGGLTFSRAWWSGGKNRYDASDEGLRLKAVARWQAWDTALSESDDAAWTAMVEGELWPDYRMAIRKVWRARLPFPALPPQIASAARSANWDGRLRAVVIEDKASGTSALQTLNATAEPWLSDILVGFVPTEDKETRARLAAVWCKLGCVLLPEPSEAAPWLNDFESELFDFPNATAKDQVDALSELILYVENLLAEGWHARGAPQ